MPAPRGPTSLSIPLLFGGPDLVPATWNDYCLHVPTSFCYIDMVFSTNQGAPPDYSWLHQSRHLGIITYLWGKGLTCARRVFMPFLIFYSSAHNFDSSIHTGMGLGWGWGGVPMFMFTCTHGLGWPITFTFTCTHRHCTRIMWGWG